MPLLKTRNDQYFFRHCENAIVQLQANKAISLSQETASSKTPRNDYTLLSSSSVLINSLIPLPPVISRKELFVPGSTRILNLKNSQHFLSVLINSISSSSISSEPGNL